MAILFWAEKQTLGDLHDSSLAEASASSLSQPNKNGGLTVLAAYMLTCILCISVHGSISECSKVTLDTHQTFAQISRCISTIFFWPQVTLLSAQFRMHPFPKSFHPGRRAKAKLLVVMSSGTQSHGHVWLNKVDYDCDLCCLVIAWVSGDNGGNTFTASPSLSAAWRS